MNHWLELLHTVLQGQFAAGGLLLMAVGSILAMAKSVPLKLWKWVLRQTTITLTIIDDSRALIWFKWWFQTHPHAKKIRLVDAYVEWADQDEDRKALLTPAPGNHWLWHKGRPVHVNFARSDEKKTTYNEKRTESFTIRTIGRDQRYLRDLLRDLQRAYVNQTEGHASLHILSGMGEWSEAGAYLPRTLESVILPEEIKQKLVEDIQLFQGSQEWYQHHGIPYRRGYVLYGLPGTGKTSLINGLANYFKKPVYVLNLNSVTDEGLLGAIVNTPKNAVVLLEDIDCAVAKRGLKKSSKDESKDGPMVMKGVSLSGLLNALDGVHAPNGTLFFMTTNHIEKLDPALLRAGRSDVKIEFKEATEWQKSTLYARFFDKDGQAEMEQFIKDIPAKTVAEFQGLLLIERNKRLSNKN